VDHEEGEVMSKRDRRSRDQKRKAKLAKRAHKAREHTSALAYTGTKYKKDEYVPLVFRTELGIHEADVMTDRKLTDRDVQRALEKLVLELRQDTLPPPDQRDEVQHTPGQEEDLLTWNIRRNWQILDEEQDVPFGKEATIGVLRTILGSIETWSSPSAHSRGYLQFIEGFLKRTGANVQAFTEGPDGELIEVEEEEEDELLELGRSFYQDGDAAAGSAFRRLADDRMHAGDGESVVGVAQQLIGELGMEDPAALKELSALSIQAQREMQKRLGPP
jgi:hypothetical protein